jgi:hypothetical protein
MRTTAVVVAVLGGLLFAVAGSTASAPRSIVRDSGPIRGFARDGMHIAWASYHPRAKCVSAVLHRNLGRGRPRSLVSPRGYTCHDDYGFQFPGEIDFAVAGNEALWVLSSSGNEHYDYVVHGVLGKPDRDIALFQHSAVTEDGDRFAGLDGAGKTLVIGWYRVTITDDSCIGGSGDCMWEVTGGSVQRIVNRRAVDLAGSPGAIHVATNGLLVALVKAHGETNRFGVPYNRRDVEVRDARSGRLVSSFRAGRNVHDLALGSKTVAFLLGPPLRIVRRDARTGALLGSTKVPAETVAIDADGSRLALKSLREIHVLNLETGRLTKVYETVEPPMGLSVSKGRVSWAVNVRGKGYASSLAVP